MKKIHIKLKFLIALICFSAFSCEIEEVLDPNNPSLEGVLIDASKAELQGLVTGLEARQRVYFENATEMFGSFGREVAPFFASDPRFFSDWLGQSGPETYPDFFAATGTYIFPYLAVKQANILIESVENTDAVTATESAGYIGFAKTIKAYQLLWPLLQQYQNGIRVDVGDIYNPGPFLDYNQALQEIRDLLDDAKVDLESAGTSFDFRLKMGFDTPAEMIEVNRAIAARCALYAEDWDGALAALTESFIDFNVGDTDDGRENMYIGPAHVYGNDPDIPNPLFYNLDAATNTILIVHPAMVEDLLPNDFRGNKFYERANPVVSGSFPYEGEYQDNRWEFNDDPIPFIRNEELLFIYAEAQLMDGNTPEAVNTINLIRNTWGVGDYAGGTSQDELMDEILFQRRYSLWAEGGHRWIDLRRTGNLNSTYVDLRDGGSIITQVDRPTSETNWDANN